MCAALVAAGMGRVAEAWVGSDRMHAADEDAYTPSVFKTGTGTPTSDACGRPTTREA